jgi:hypothetical protein
VCPAIVNLDDRNMSRLGELCRVWAGAGEQAPKDNHAALAESPLQLDDSLLSIALVPDLRVGWEGGGISREAE